MPKLGPLKRMARFTDYLQQLLLLGEYHVWYSQAEWTRWNHGILPDGSHSHDPDKILEEGRRDIALTYDPVIGSYDSSDTETLKYHIRLAQAIGIDGFLVNWYGARDSLDSDFGLQDRNFQDAQ